MRTNMWVQLEGCLSHFCHPHLCSRAGVSCGSAAQGLFVGSKDQQNQCNLTPKLATSKLPDGAHVCVRQSQGHLSPDGSKESISSPCG